MGIVDVFCVSVCLFVCEQGNSNEVADGYRRNLLRRSNR